MINVREAQSFFGPNDRPQILPSDAVPPDWQELVERTASLDSTHYPVDSLAQILATEHTRLGVPEQSLKAIDSMSSDSVFVVCGQQAGLFGGPLYTLYKALHAVRLAQRLGDAAGRNVVPVFWIASDDHDFDEVAGIGIRSSDGSTQRAGYRPSSYREGMPVGDVVLGDGIGEAILALEKSLPPGERSSHYLNIVREAWRPGVKWADAFAAQMAAICGQYGLVLLDPRWPGIKRLFSSVMADEIKQPLASTDHVNKQADRLEKSGGQSAA
ncbi:bacillithiol biosynthesis BshC, partial [Candidatus Latescibacterota bacterium]